MTTTRTPLRRRRPVLTTLLLLAAHGVAVVVLVMLALSVALAIGGPTVGRDELYRMGPALQLAVAGAVLPFGVAVLLASLVGLAAPRRAWLVPAFGICTSVVFCATAMLFLHPPAPLLGG
ncbi:hypothetical protein [Leifsonia sp. 21MFCrub1.1]|uniref:hypothetical protein n=1 Tax=Leifsonia sp. 21MFCrub1.1 TaxID=1798223 RepID=UPI00089294A8|nr:hypothetical protein [Leifsonia sp. 21MFCrub1.1]SEA76295.1 hypothetical protein SAMN04515680_1457 [Leifsonia sp. 21MFCrub1.1]